MDSEDILIALSTLVQKGILVPSEFWLSNYTALAVYGIKDKIDYITLNAKRMHFNAILKRNRDKGFVAEDRFRKRMIKIQSNVYLYEDTRPYKYMLVGGFRVETVYSIISKKLFYGSTKDILEADRIRELAKERRLWVEEK